MSDESNIPTFKLVLGAFAILPYPVYVFPNRLCYFFFHRCPDRTFPSRVLSSTCLIPIHLCTRWCDHTQLVTEEQEKPLSSRFDAFLRLITRSRADDVGLTAPLVW